MPLLAGFMVPHPPLIIPAVGKGGEEEIEETTRAYQRIADEVAALKPETIIITSPHSIMYADYFHISPGRSAKGSFMRFGAPQVRFSEEYDTDLVEAISDLAYESGFPAGTMGERERALDHGTMVPLFFIEQKYRDFKLVRTGLSGLSLADHYKFGQMISKAIDQTGRRTVIIASGDLSHKLQEYGPYGYSPEGPEYDNRIMDVMGRAAFGELLEFDESFLDKAAECGHRSFVIMAGAMDGRKVRAEIFSHQDVTGVGYGTGTFYPGEPDETRCFLDKYLREEELRTGEARASEDPYVRLARQSLESYIRTGRKIDIPEDLPTELTDTRAGAFVSIHKQGRLRGCIGTIEATEETLAEEIINNAISASTRDPRFSEITEDELKWLEINVDVLGEPEPIFSMDQLDPKRYGVIVQKGYRRGLLLPDLDGVDTAEQQVSIARQKAGIRPDEEIRMQRFEVIRHR